MYCEPKVRPGPSSPSLGSATALPSLRSRSFLRVYLEYFLSHSTYCMNKQAEFVRQKIAIAVVYKFVEIAKIWCIILGKLFEKVRSWSCNCEMPMSVVSTNKNTISARLSDLLVDLRHHRREHVHGEVPQVHRHKHRREVFARNHSQQNDLLLGESSQQKRRLDQSDHQLR